MVVVAGAVAAVGVIAVAAVVAAVAGGIVPVGGGSLMFDHP